MAGLCFSIPWPIHSLVQQREFAYNPLNSDDLDSNLTVNIIVLGAGTNDDEQLENNLALSKEVLCRLVEGVKWCHSLPNATLICSGPKGDRKQSQADLLKRTALSLGVDNNRVYLIDQGYNTELEAKHYVDLIGADVPLILCTSALHMERAVALFKSSGVQKIYPAPAWYSAPHETRAWKLLIPNWSSFTMWQSYLKEVFGELLIPKHQKST